MAAPVHAWHDEHAYFFKLLDQLRLQVDLFENGERPDYERMLEIIRELRETGDRQHHPREEVAFERLVAREPDLQLRLQRLRQEHRVIAHAGDALAEQLEAVLNGVLVPRTQIEAAAATYLLYYGNHIMKEEEDVLPRAAAALTPADWAAVAAAAPRSLQQ
jgi:hemerythrin-like domain-containing protein